MKLLRKIQIQISWNAGQQHCKCSVVSSSFLNSSQIVPDIAPLLHRLALNMCFKRFTIHKSHEGMYRYSQEPEALKGKGSTRDMLRDFFTHSLKLQTGFIQVYSFSPWKAPAVNRKYASHWIFVEILCLTCCIRLLKLIQHKEGAVTQNYFVIWRPS